MIQRFEVWQQSKMHPALGEAQLAIQIKDGEQRLTRLGKALQQAEDRHNKRRLVVSSSAFLETATIVLELREVQRRRQQEAFSH